MCAVVFPYKSNVLVYDLLYIAADCWLSRDNLTHVTKHTKKNNTRRERGEREREACEDKEEEEEGIHEED